MPVLETIAAVAAIVGCFQAASSFYQTRKGRKEAKKRAENDESVEKSLSLGRIRSQDEYNRDFARLGRKFAVGDGRTHSTRSGVFVNSLMFAFDTAVGRENLMMELITLQQTVITILSNTSTPFTGFDLTS